MPNTDRPTVIVTGASACVGLQVAQSRCDQGWVGVMACRVLAKAAHAAQPIGIAAEPRAVLALDLGSQASVRAFVADTALCRDTPKAFRTIFPWVQKHLTRACGAQALAGERLAPVVADEAFARSGVHGRCGKRQQAGRRAFAQPLSARASDAVRSSRLWRSSEKRVGLA